MTVIRGYRGTSEKLKELGKYLQSSCSTGGTVKNNEILIQGNFREKARDLLQTKGYQAKLSAVNALPVTQTGGRYGNKLIF